MLELAKKIIATAKSHSAITFCDLPADDPKQRKPDISMARNVLGWEPQVQLDLGLEKTVSYFLARLSNLTTS
jgi:UDP-glucuronate decarboxylase